MEIKMIEFKNVCTDKAEGITTQDREDNMNFLREGVVGVKCTFAGCLSDALVSGLPGTESVLMTMNCRCCPDEYIGTVELYANGAINAYLKQRNVPVAIGIFRSR